MGLLSPVIILCDFNIISDLFSITQSKILITQVASQTCPDVSVKILFVYPDNKPDWKELVYPITILCAKASCQSRYADLIVYLELRVELNEKTGLMVPHQHKPWLDRHHQVNTHLVNLSRKHMAAALYHLEVPIFKLDFIILWVSTWNEHAVITAPRKWGGTSNHFLNK